MTKPISVKTKFLGSDNTAHDSESTNVTGTGCGAFFTKLLFFMKTIHGDEGGGRGMGVEGWVLARLARVGLRYRTHCFHEVH